MTVERRKDNSITIKGNNGSVTIGKIQTTYVYRREENFKKWVNDCAKLVTACPHTFKETEQYFLEQCDTLPLPFDDRQMRNFQANFIISYCKDRLVHQAPEFSFDMTDDEIEKWHKEDEAMKEEARNASPEQLGLIMRGYYLPHTKRNEVFYEDVSLQAKKLMKHIDSRINQMQAQDICFFFEETTEYFQIYGNGADLAEKLIIFRGVSEDDIKERNSRFLVYISTLRDMGELPDFIKE